MRYFAEVIPTTKNSIELQEIISVYSQDNPPVPVSKDGTVIELSDIMYFMLRSTIESSVGRPLADIVKNDTYHKVPYDGTDTLFERYNKTVEASSI